MVLETHVLAPTSLLTTALILIRPCLATRLWNRPSTSTLAAFGVFLHSICGRAESFLFAANYTRATVTRSAFPGDPCFTGRSAGSPCASPA